MKRDVLPQLSDETLDSTLAAAYSHEWTSKVFVLALLAEVDARKRYLKLGFPSMIAYCLGKFPLCDQAAYKRIQAARAGRRFPEIFEALEDRRLHLSAVVMLAPHLTKHSVSELIAAATRKSKSEIERMLADRNPRPDLAPQVREISTCSQALAADQLSPGIVGNEAGVSTARADGGVRINLDGAGTESPVDSDRSGVGALVASDQVGGVLPTASDRTAAESTVAAGASAEGLRFTSSGATTPEAPVANPQRPRLTPLGAQRFAVQFTMDQSAHDDLVRVQELLSHQLPSGDIARTFALALQSLRRDLERRKFAATSKPRAARASAGETRHIPAEVKRAVWERDGGKCTFVGDNGQRCGSRKLVEFDHVTEVARGGVSNISGLRPRCRAHNQYGAECTFGAEFMRRKREAATGIPATESRSLLAQWNQRQSVQLNQRQ